MATVEGALNAAYLKKSEHSMKESPATSSRSMLLVVSLGDTHCFKIRTGSQKGSPSPYT